MDGRDLFIEVCPKWTPKTKLIQIISEIIPFCAKVINNKTYQFFGTFHIESIYNMKVFDHMIVSKYAYSFNSLFFNYLKILKMIKVKLFFGVIYYQLLTYK